CQARRKLHIGEMITKGRGAGMNPELGRQSAEENREEVSELLKDADMVFLTAGFGGGTGTGAAPVVADIAKEKGILTVAVVTKPFTFEGEARMRIAEEGIARIKDKVDTLLVIPNDRIFNIVDNNTSMLKAFEKIDEVLKSAVQGVAEIITSTGLVNVDFADIKAIMADAGPSIIGVGIASGNDRAVKAARQAINSPLLETSVDGAKGLLLGVAGGRDMRIAEINEAAKIVTENIDPAAKIIFGAYHDRKLKAGQIKITLIATGFNGLSRRREADSLNLFPFSKEKMMEREGKENSDDKKKISEETVIKNEDEALDVPAFLRRKKR
ncbi:MAG: cell division protein FtsZ, partial [Patescibacteria group bacterium]|nr:cell division protein FtsZ [Patescibacteria group bacterium]